MPKWQKFPQSGHTGRWAHLEKRKKGEADVMNGTHKEEEDVGGGMPLFKINFVKIQFIKDISE